MSQERKTILLVDDDTAHRTMLRANLEADFDLVEAEDGDQVLDILAAHPVDLILLDLKMRRMDGIDTLRALQEAGRYLPVIVITAFSSVETAVAAMKEGALDYVTKPVDLEVLRLTIDRALHFERLQHENETLRRRLGERFNYGAIIGRSRAMQELFETLALVSPSDATVLIQGESGTGKELVANVIHQNSPRRDHPFVKVNCAALHENLLESQLFGHERGAFTGAVEQRRGLFEQAHTGTIFLDEIGDMSLVTQAKVLRVLQEREFERLGSTTTIQVDIRLIAATHKDLAAMVKEGTFRQDLFFRLNVVPVSLPPLRQRREDIPLLAEHFLRRFAEKNRKPLRAIHPVAMARLCAYDWPGNIRELENTIERAVILCLGEEITPADLPPQLQAATDVPASPPVAAAGTNLKEMERLLITATLRDTGGNRSHAARLLGISRQTLLNKIKEYGITDGS